MSCKSDSNIYRKQTVNVMEQDIDDVVDKNDFNVKLLSYKLQWEKLCPGFYEWFATHCKKIAERNIQSARAMTNVEGLHYQNNVELLHATD